MSDLVSSQSVTAAPSIAILGVPFDNVSTAQAVELIERMVASRRPHYLATANVDFLVQSATDEQLRHILLHAHLVLCDGTPLVWASRWLGNPLAERVAGSDLIPLLIQVAATKGYRLFFLGGREDVNEKAVQNIRAKHPGVQIAGFYSPPFAPLAQMDHAAIRARIREAKPDLLLVSFGCPKQEKWIALNYEKLGVPVSVGVGATIDFLAGAVSRAPRWMQRSGLEWLFRLLQEPRRLFKRYVKDFWVFGRALLWQWWKLKGRSPLVRSSSRPPPITCPVEHQISFPERLDAATVQEHQATWESALAASGETRLDLSAVTFIDSTGVGLLIRLARKSRERGSRIVLVRPSEAVDKALRLMRLSDFFSVVPVDAVTPLDLKSAA
jgi:N-acetylglucosaminyldiphosphoundecaprenol N-acetyl-beta-D-mannosaminyltransferase